MKYDDLKIKKLGIRDLKPCSFCGGPLKGGIFRVITVQMADINPRAINAFLGTMQITGSARIAEAMSPCDDAIEVLTEPDATSTLFMCNDCQTKEWCIAEVCEQESERLKKAQPAESER